MSSRLSMEGKSFTQSPYFPFLSIIIAGVLVVAAIFIGQIDLSPEEEKLEGREWRREYPEEDSREELVDTEETIEGLEEEVRELEKELERVRAEKETMEVKEDAPLRIKICEAEAKIYAENRDREAHIENFKKAIEDGDIESAQTHLEASYEPKRTDDWVENYHKTYILCLEEE